MPIAGPSKIPFFWPPAEMYTLSHPGADPTIGIQSGVTGRRQAVCLAMVAFASEGTRRTAFFSIWSRASSVRERSNSASSSVAPHQIRPSVFAYIELPAPISSYASPGPSGCSRMIWPLSGSTGMAMSSHCSAVRHHGPAAISSAAHGISPSLVTTDSTLPLPRRSPIALVLTTLLPRFTAAAAKACVNSWPSSAPLPTARTPPMISGETRGSIASTSSRSSHSAEKPGSVVPLNVDSVSLRSGSSSSVNATFRMELNRP